MGNGRGKINTPFVAIAFALLVVAVVFSLILYPEWRQTPTQVFMLIVLAVVGVVGFLSNAKSIFIRDNTDAPPPPLDYDSPQHRRNQENVTANVRGAWIDGVLRESLPERVRLELALDHPPGKLQRTIVTVEGQEPRREPASAGDIADIFRASGRALLILGAPGSGKTVTLVELCRPVLEGAEADPRRPVPVVLNLSTWAQKQAPLEAWIADEMWRQYGLNRQVTPVWLAADHLILLLDGLDEVAAEARDACVRAINAFRETHGAGMAVCSRSADYAELRERLALSNAVEIQPLTAPQIEGYLRDERLALDGVREAIARDDALRELATTPLMLNVMAVAYGGRPLAKLLPLLDSEDERRAHLYDAYLTRMFRRKPLAGVSYTAGQALRWLRFLATRLTERDETQFFIEDMQPDWLPGRWGRWVRIILGVLVGVLLGVLVGVLVSAMIDMLVVMKEVLLVGVMVGVLFGVVAGTFIAFGLGGEIVPVDELAMIVNRKAISESLKTGLLLGVIGGVIGGILVGLLDWQVDYTATRVPGGVLLGVLVGVLIFPSGRVLRSVLTPQQSKRRNKPNEGIRRSVNNAAIGGALTGVFFSILVSIVLGMWGGLLLDIQNGVRFGVLVGGLSGGLLGGIMGGLVYGGDAVIQHYFLRLLLALHTLLPLNLVPFLEAMRERILMQRAGAHYRFIHRTLQEHVAALSYERIEAICGSKTSEVF